MITLTIRTDNPQAEMGIYENEKQLAYMKWEAHRTLTATIHRKLDELLNGSSKSKDDIKGVICFKGPGSFTGLRIGLSVANALAYSYQIPIVATKGKNWLQDGIKLLAAGKNEKVVQPEYDKPAATSKPRK